jgi:hypothetical protein
MEDKNQFINLPLINTLRTNTSDEDINNRYERGKKKEGGEEDKKSETNHNAVQTTIPNPPSFFDQDLEKWSKKFAKSIKERETFKRSLGKYCELTCMTKNTNIKEDDAGKG